MLFYTLLIQIISYWRCKILEIVQGCVVPRNFAMQLREHRVIVSSVRAVAFFYVFLQVLFRSRQLRVVLCHLCQVGVTSVCQKTSVNMSVLSLERIFLQEVKSCNTNLISIDSMDFKPGPSQKCLVEILQKIKFYAVVRLLLSMFSHLS